MKLEGRKITLHDMCLRDGMHPKQHQITVDQMIDIAGALDDAGVDVLDVVVRRPSLDDVFLALTGHVASAEEATS